MACLEIEVTDEPTVQRETFGLLVIGGSEVLSSAIPGGM